MGQLIVQGTKPFGLTKVDITLRVMNFILLRG